MSDRELPEAPPGAAKTPDTAPMPPGQHRPRGSRRRGPARALQVFGWVLGILVFLVAVMWFVVPFLIETSWAKERIRAALVDATGRSASVGRARFSWFHGLTLSDVVLDQKKGQLSSEGPLLRMEQLRVDVSLRDALRREINFEKIQVIQPAVVIVRNEAGNLNIQDLMSRKGRSKSTFSAKIGVKDARVVYIDERFDVRVDLERLDVAARWADQQLRVEGQFELNGGPGQLEARLDLRGRQPRFSIPNLELEAVALDRSLPQLAWVVPILGLEGRDVSGDLDLQLQNVEGRGLDRAALAQSLAGRGRILLEGGVVMSSVVARLFDLVSSVAKTDPAVLFRGSNASEVLAGRTDERALVFRDIAGAFKIENGRVQTDDLVVEAADFDLAISGWTDLSGRLNYVLRSEKLAELIQENLPAAVRKAERLGAEFKPPPITLTGSLRAPRVNIDLAGQAEDAAQALLEAQRDRLESRIDRELRSTKRKAEEQLEEGARDAAKRIFGFP